MRCSWNGYSFSAWHLDWCNSLLYTKNTTSSMYPYLHSAHGIYLLHVHLPHESLRPHLYQILACYSHHQRNSRLCLVIHEFFRILEPLGKWNQFWKWGRILEINRLFNIFGNFLENSFGSVSLSLPQRVVKQKLRLGLGNGQVHIDSQ